MLWRGFGQATSAATCIAAAVQASISCLFLASGILCVCKCHCRGFRTLLWTIHDVGHPPFHASGNFCRPVGKTSLGKTTLYRLRDYGAPASWVRLVMYVASVSAPVRDLDLLELFCGQGMLHKSAKLLGLASAGMDRELNPKLHDLLTTRGLLHAILAVLRLRVNSLLFLGIPCSSWVWLNRGTSKRSKSNPLGDTSIPSVATTSQLTSRCALLIMTAVARGSCWLLEQPSSSLLPHHPRMAQLLHLSRDLVFERPANTLSCVRVFPHADVLFSGQLCFALTKVTRGSCHRSDSPASS